MSEALKKTEQLIPLPEGAEGEAAARRGQILALEQALFQMTERHIAIEPVHHFAQGLYARQILLPKGCVATGRIHLKEHFNFILSGELSVATEDGMERIKAPAFFVSKPGVKKAGWAHEDTVWITVHACDETDIEKVEAALVVDTFEQYAAKQAALGAQSADGRLLTRGEQP